MINLEPIAKSVQKRLFEKMRALGRETSYSDSPTDVLTQQEMMSRTTFIKMASNQSKPVILMGGELLHNGGIRGGYDEIYGSRGIESSMELAMMGETSEAKTAANENPNKRPMPGVKSIDVTFKGGARAQREATINWTCWSFEDINRLTPHFLAHGKEVLLEWGWVYNTKSLINLPTFLELDGKTKRNAYRDYISEILSGDGDFDMMVGLVKNFEYTTRADGGFDCQTILGSIGVSIVDNTIPNDHKADGGDVTEANLSKRATRRLTDEQIVTYDTSVSMKTFLRTAGLYFGEKCQKMWDNRIIPKTKDAAIGKAIYVEPNKWIATSLNDYSKLGSGLTGGVNVWVRWGWFEDNILSKFTSLVSGKDIISQFRSVDVDIKTNKQTSVKIRNSKYLETINFNTYILPGQFLPETRKRTIEIGENKDEIELEPDNDFVIKLANAVNQNFPSFSVDAPGFQETGDAVVVPKGTKSGPNGEPVIVNSKGVSYYKQRILKNNNSEFGYLRNMLISLRVIKGSFGIRAQIEDMSSEAINIKESMESLFLKLNEPIDFWSFELEQDAIRSERARIIDNQITAIDFTKPIPSQASSYDGVDVRNLGIFYFPVWRHDSIVKSQNVSARVPNAMALATMYGSNLDQLKYPNSDFGVTGEKEGLVVGGLNNENKDERHKNLDFAFKQSLNIGTPNGFASEQIRVNDSTDDIMDFLKTKVDDIKDYYEEKEDRNREMGTSTSNNDAGFDQSKPKPMIRYMTPEQKQKFFEQATLGDEKYIQNFYGQKYDYNIRGEITSGKLRQDYIKSIEYLTKTHPETKTSGGDNNKSVLIPLEMELVIDGTGGIYPGNSFHSSYLPQNYKDKTVFQMFDVNHTVDGGGWSTTISGKMRSTINQVFTEIADDPDLLQDLIDGYINKRKGEEEFTLDTTENAKDKVIELEEPDDPNVPLPDWWKGGFTIQSSNLENVDNVGMRNEYKIISNEMEIRSGYGGVIQKWGTIIEEDEEGNIVNK